ncbi:MAG: S9 family peptidase [Porphyromonadaceae bacterium CG2_30_38_12]|nr:MAG: S9 family peptidase [Porphyromonadaceae bacterium CG2_30_38_12]
MKRFGIFSVSLLLAANLFISAQKISYPITEKEKVVDTYFGVEVNEPYRWLENDTSKATANWVTAQTKVTSEYLSQIPFRNDLKKKLTKLMNYPKYGAPFKKNGKYYFFKNNGLQNQSVFYEQADLTSDPNIILDPNTFSTDGTVALASLAFSKNGNYLGYAISRSGSDWNEIFVLDMQTRQLLTDHIKWSKSSQIAWHGNGFYYSAFDAPEAGKEYSTKNEYQKIYYHAIGQPQSADELVYEDKLHALRECYAQVTDDEKILIISITETTTGNSLLMKDLTQPSSNFIELAKGFDNDYSVIDHLHGKLYLLTNWKAPKKRLMEIDLTQLSNENWKEILPETDNVLESVTIIGKKIIANYLKDATNHLYGYDLAGKKLYEVQLPALGTVSGISGEHKDTEAFYMFTAYTFPATIYRFDTNENRSELFHSSDVAFKPSDYVSEQVFYASKDGTKVPMSIIYKKGMKKNGKNPLLLYGYGGFNISLKPSFNVSRIPFLENGGIYVVANLRGGGEYGEAWHVAGTKMKKQNVFDDFIAAAEYLIAQVYTSSRKLAIDGGSNGGLLVGACLAQRPDLYAVAIPEVGVLDMLRYHKFTIGWSWTSDYGNSEESKEMFEYLKAYSPLHSLKAGVNYPATLVMTGDHDDRVVPAHSFKFAATLQAANKSAKPTLIRIDSKAGHGAGKPTAKVIDAQTDMWSFVMWNLGMTPTF